MFTIPSIEEVMLLITSKILRHFVIKDIVCLDLSMLHLIMNHNLFSFENLRCIQDFVITVMLKSWLN